MSARPIQHNWFSAATLGPILIIVFGLALMLTPLASVSSMGTVGNAGGAGKPGETTTTTTMLPEVTTTTIAEMTTTTTTMLPEVTTTTIAEVTTTAVSVPVTTLVEDAVVETTEPAEVPSATTVAPASGGSRPDLPATGPERSTNIFVLGLLVSALGVGLLLLGRRTASS